MSTIMSTGNQIINDVVYISDRDEYVSLRFVTNLRYKKETRCCILNIKSYSIIFGCTESFFEAVRDTFCNLNTPQEINQRREMIK